jgi:hypothetical protein
MFSFVPQILLHRKNSGGRHLYVLEARIWTPTSGELTTAYSVFVLVDVCLTGIYNFWTRHPFIDLIIEWCNTINYLDMPIHKTEHNIGIAVYRKPTFTVTISPFSFNHPI